MSKLLEVKHLKKTYKDRFLFSQKEKEVLRDISFYINENEIFGLVGESGSGKTTLSNIILKLLEPTEGEILFEGKNITNLSKDELFQYRRDVQVVFQNPSSALNPKKTIGFSVEEILNIHNLYDKTERRAKVVEILKDVELDESVLNSYPRSLSGGQKQRIAIAAALVGSPKFLIIDEGVSALDVSIQAQVLNLISDLKDKYKFSSLFISHDLNVISYICDRIGVLNQGNLVDIFPTHQLEDKDRHPYTKKLFNTTI